jgi:hypothetical protein
MLAAGSGMRYKAFTLVPNYCFTDEDSTKMPTLPKPEDSDSIFVDQWNPSQRRYRTETFCYGPRSCPLYRSGPERKVPGRRGMSYTEEDWVTGDGVTHLELVFGVGAFPHANKK